jgi:hypothetical protein
MAQVFIVSFDEPGVIAKGKGSANIIKRFSQSLMNMGVQSEALTFEQLIERGTTDDPQAFVLLHYNELFLIRDRKVSWLQSREAEIKALGYNILHSADAGRIVGHKSRQNKALISADVPMPRELKNSDRFDVAFSNAVNDAHVPTQLIDGGTALDESRYNTDYVDCRHDYDGQLWNVCLRAQVVGAHVLFAWVRAGTGASVHTRDTPVDAGMIRHFHNLLIVPNMDQIKTIAARVKEALGVGLFAHDILPCRETGRLLLCETNFKFYDGNYRFLMKPIADQHPNPAFFDGRKVGRRMARALISELELEPQKADA